MREEEDWLGDEAEDWLGDDQDDWLVHEPEQGLGQAPPELVGPEDDIPLRPAGPGEVQLPDLSRTPRERWKEALRPLDLLARHHATYNLAGDDQWFAMELRGELELEDGDRRRRSFAVVPELPVPQAEPRVGRRGRQVGFRLDPRQYAQLEETAALHGVRPATLARMFTMRGVRSALQQWRREDS